MPPPIDRVVIVVLDSAGAGAMPDAASFGDEGAATIANTAMAAGGLRMPNMARLGLGNALRIRGVEPAAAPEGFFGVMAEASAAKDTTSGHWEIAGLVSDEAFSVFQGGFPPEIMGEFVKRAGVAGFLGNKAASGTAIIEELGPGHERAGIPIVYTSADSVFQIAAHESVIPLPELYRICEAARAVLDPWRVARVIARPFIGKAGSYKRTYNRRDFSMPPPSQTLLDLVSGAGMDVTGVGKIEDIFCGKGLTKAVHTEGNRDGMEKTAVELQALRRGLLFTNLVDFDMIFGHRRNPRGYAAALEEFDALLPELLSGLNERDLLVITADHGCDPTIARHTDHTREYVPLVVFSPANRNGRSLGTRSSFADAGRTAAEALGAAPTRNGKSFLGEILHPV